MGFKTAFQRAAINLSVVEQSEPWEVKRDEESIGNLSPCKPGDSQGAVLSEEVLLITLDF